MKDTINGITSVFYVNPITAAFPVAMHGERFIENAAGDETRHQFFKVLQRSEVVERSDNYRRDFVGVPIRINQAIGSSFCCSIRAGWKKVMFFIHLRSYSCSIDFRSRNMNETFYAIFVLEN